jgi:hypothetical protein
MRVRWPADAGAAAATGYVLQMASDPAFSGDVVTFPPGERAFDSPPGTGTYFVRVARAWNGRASGISAPQRIDLQSVLRDGQGAVIVTGGAKKGVQLAPNRLTCAAASSTRPSGRAPRAPWAFVGARDWSGRCSPPPCW